VRRRQFLALVAGAVAFRPLAGRAQTVPPVVGFLHSGSPAQNRDRLAAYLRGLRDGGKATSTIPIVFAIGADPVAVGLVGSLAHPGGNATGITSQNGDLGAKQLQLLRQLAPGIQRCFALINPTSQIAAGFLDDLQRGAARLGLAADVLRAADDAELAAVFANLPPDGHNAVAVSPDSFFYIRRAKLTALALQYAIPAIFDDRAYAGAGGLVSYGADWLDVMRLAGRYSARVLRGAKPAYLPVIQADKFDLAINLTTARALGLAVPPLLLAQADEVIP
jgi:putative ABC transport system substrate-binding protein